MPDKKDRKNGALMIWQIKLNRKKRTICTITKYSEPENLHRTRIFKEGVPQKLKSNIQVPSA